MPPPQKIDLAETVNEDIADMESELDIIRRQYAGYPPFPLDDVDYDEDDNE
ncbi:MAG: hypothetical protein H7Y09_13835 [Chitinophagaceae bacterium]|nr:hypothetical protein [Anaerolineae bacterium]